MNLEKERQRWQGGYRRNEDGSVDKQDYSALREPISRLMDTIHVFDKVYQRKQDTKLLGLPERMNTLHKIEEYIKAYSQELMRRPSPERAEELLEAIQTLQEWMNDGIEKLRLLDDSRRRQEAVDALTQFVNLENTFTALLEGGGRLGDDEAGEPIMDPRVYNALRMLAEYERAKKK